MADERLQGGRRVDLALGANVALTVRILEGHRPAVEAGLPLRQSLEGPRLETDWLVTAGGQYPFRLFGDGG